MKQEILKNDASSQYYTVHYTGVPHSLYFYASHSVPMKHLLLICY